MPCCLFSSPIRAWARPGLDPGLDIKPGSCPNPFNPNSNGVLPVALVGTGAFDVSQVDLSTLLISREDGVGGSVPPNEGPPGRHSVIEDVASQFRGLLCDCHALTGDGIDDLSMKFRSAELADVLQLTVPEPDPIKLCVRGNLVDGTAFGACDCIRLVPPRSMAVLSNLSGVWVDVTPPDEDSGAGGSTPFGRNFLPTQLVTVTAPVAPAEHPNQVLDRAMIDGVQVPVASGEGTASIELVIDDASQTVDFIYRALADANGDGAVNVLDLIAVLMCFGQPASPPCNGADVNQDATVNVLDLVDLLLAIHQSANQEPADSSTLPRKTPGSSIRR